MADKNLAVNMLINTNRMHKKLIDSSVYAEIGFHRTQHIILMELSRNNKLPSQKEIAERLNITPAAVTGVLRKLELDGYIERSMGSDNRYNEITITQRGRDVVAKTRDMFYRIDSSLFENFTEEEINNFVTYLERVQSNITKQTEEKQNK